MENGFKRQTLFQKLLNALNGALMPYQTEISIRIQTLFVLTGVMMGLYFHISGTEWACVTIAAAVLLITECLNTALEKLVDLVSPGYHELAGKVKDIAAGAVFMAGLAAFAVALIVFVPYFWSK